MTQPFTPAQSAEIDDRIVEMIVAIMGEGQYSRACRAIANKRYLDRQADENEGNGDRSERAPPSEGRAHLPTIRLECLKLALQHDATNIRRAIDLAAEFERQVQAGFRIGPDPRIAADTARMAAILSEAADNPGQPGQDADDHRRWPDPQADRADHE